MSAGNPTLYERAPDGKRRRVSSSWRRTVYKYAGQWYAVTGNAWTGFYRVKITTKDAKRHAESIRQDLPERFDFIGHCRFHKYEPRAHSASLPWETVIAWNPWRVY